MRPMLSQEELRRRVRAARVLADDMTQAEMNEAGHARGLGKHELGNAERGDIDIRQYHLPMLCEILEVPMSWFTEPREAIVAQRPQDLDQVLGVLERWLKEQAAGGEAPPRSQTRGRGR
jgi:hypothetical protein